ncbi:hypothetical protein [Nocardia vulneris]|uniref:Uncharacterized protein n=1 Tax=Nocardia vulneris TaxID=1141657 RepID=A0ABR4ZEL6_9NOCA|nr:hypothetical protein [Nocardia vulneris]KIA63832.1 hypothetical protein FG87_17200 [Nocardia vulneris]
MASGDGPDEDAAGSSPSAEAPDAPPIVGRGIDPSVEGVWLRHRLPPRPGRPRISTVLLVLAFIALFTVWVLFRPAG